MTLDTDLRVGYLRGVLAITDLSSRPAPGFVTLFFVAEGTSGVFDEYDLDLETLNKIDPGLRESLISAFRKWQSDEQRRLERTSEESRQLGIQVQQKRERDLESLSILQLDDRRRYKEARLGIIESRHRDYMLRCGFAMAGLFAPPSSSRSHRLTICWNCTKPLDSDVDDLACSRCGWIVCLCGACGCGHEKGCMDRDRLNTKYN